MVDRRCTLSSFDSCISNSRTRLKPYSQPPKLTLTLTLTLTLSTKLTQLHDVLLVTRVSRQRHEVDWLQFANCSQSIRDADTRDQ